MADDNGVEKSTNKELGANIDTSVDAADNQEKKRGGQGLADKWHSLSKKTR